MAGLKKVAKGYNNKGRWDESFKDDMFQIPSRATRVRLHDEFTSIPTHWVEFFSKKQKGNTGFYALCLNHDYESGEHADNGCPYCEAGMRVNNYNYGFVISRREQKNALQIRPIRLTAKCTNDILRLTDVAYPDEDWPDGWKSEDGDGPDATHPKYGFDITIAMVKNNKKTEYEVHVADEGKKPLKKSEWQAFKDYSSQVSFGELAKAGLETRQEVVQKLGILGISGEGGGDDEEGGSTGGKKTSGKSYDKYDEVPDEDEEAEEKAKPAAKKPASKKPTSKPPAAKAKPVQSLTDDEEEADGDDAPREGLPWDGEDEDEEGLERSYSDPDEADAPDEEEYEED